MLFSHVFKLWERSKRLLDVSRAPRITTQVVRGSKNRNRALHGDVVVLSRILYGREESSDEEVVVASGSDSEEEIVFAKPNVGGSLATRQDEDVQMAKVVAIAEKKGSERVIVCTLYPEKKREDGLVHAEDGFIKAVPTDKRLPPMLMQMNERTKNALKLFELPGKLDPFQLWPLQIIVWNEKSQQPLAKLQGQCLGRAGSLQAEEKHALIANELDTHDRDFPEDELDEALIACTMFI